MGHVSDSVQKYQTTSDKQRESMSKFLQGIENEPKLSQAQPMEIVNDVNNISIEEKFKLPKLVLSKSNNKSKSESNKIANMIESAIEAVGRRKAKITFQIELLD